MRPLTHASRLFVAYQIISSVANELPEEQRKLFADFCHHILDQVTVSYLSRHDPAQLPERLRELFLLSYERADGQLKLDTRHREGQRYVLRNCMRDQPFIVSTIRVFLQSRGTHRGGIMATLPVQRDERGVMQSIGGDAPIESFVQIEVEAKESIQLDRELKHLEQNLALVQVMVSDFQTMRDQLSQARQDLLDAAVGSDLITEYMEAASFLEWLLSENFILMGVRMGDSGWGVDRPDSTLSWVSTLSDGNWEQRVDNLPLRVRKGHQEAPIHRMGRIDQISVAVPAAGHREAQDLLIQGLFTYRGVSQPSSTVPVLRSLLSTLLEQSNSRAGSWERKVFTNVFDSLPTEFLFTTQVTEITEMVKRVQDAEREQDSRVILIQDVQGNESSFLLAAMPKARYSERIRAGFQSALTRATGANYFDHGLFVGRYDTVLAHFYMTGARLLSKDEVSALHEELVSLTLPWEEKLKRSLQEHPEGEGLFSRYRSAFDDTYQDRVSQQQTLRDIDALESLDKPRPVQCHVYRSRGRCSLRLYQQSGLLLSQLSPVLTLFGLTLVDQFSDPVLAEGSARASIHTFRLLRDLEASEERLLCEAVEAVFSNKVEQDRLHELVLSADMSWQEVDLIRAYRGYLRQLDLGFTSEQSTALLLQNPELVKSCFRLFQIRFQPDLEVEDRAAAEEAALEELRAMERGLRTAPEALLFRCLRELICGTLRTNYFQHREGDHYISFKLSHPDTPCIPKPHLLVEVYVHHALMEGVHLRGGLIARGGIRWSDRSDFRTEVLGLVTTQMTKNALIVPEGAKGGFFMKGGPTDWKQRRAEADRLYQFLIRGLLDLADNYVGGAIVHPPQVVFQDSEDPYLVVAADKGTAHLSDTANRVATEEYQFWLGDAFASGGSLGYDHKKVGITARGAWVGVRRHMREMGLDPETQSFTCVGVGDPSGDVFGNGVIEHRPMRLLAAFNHKHIFLDPDPPEGLAYEERLRMFRAAQGWEHYNTELISAGGGVFDRSVARIQLSPQAKSMLGALHDELEPVAIIRLILRMSVDLFWNGGIGTYVKSSSETHSDADDVSNDSCRVNADELRCKIVGEGGNLGFTQAGRIEYGMLGGRVNTDAVDNSGGVDMSDHEVNLKILLAQLTSAGVLTAEERNDTILRLTDEVADQVLRNNSEHTRQISLDSLRSKSDLMPFAQAMAWVTQEGGSTPADLCFPDSRTLLQRAKARQGLTRPELSVLGAHVKMIAYKQLLEGSGDTIPQFDSRVQGYFPSEIQEKYAGAIQEHMLRKAIGMTCALHQVVTQAGSFFLPALLSVTSSSTEEVIGLFLRCSQLWELETLRRDLESSSAPLESQYMAWNEVISGLSNFLVTTLSSQQSSPTDDCLRRVMTTLETLQGLRDEGTQLRLDGRLQRLLKSGIPAELAEPCAQMGDLMMAGEICKLSMAQDLSLREAVIQYQAVGQASRLLPTIQTLEEFRPQRPWDAAATVLLRGRFLQLLNDLCGGTELGAELELGADRAAHKLYWYGGMKERADLLESILGDTTDLSAFLVAEDRFRKAAL